jgi:hypothetical protein
VRIIGFFFLFKVFTLISNYNTDQQIAQLIVARNQKTQNITKTAISTNYITKKSIFFFEKKKKKKKKKICAKLPKLNRSKTSANFIRVKTQKEIERQITFENIGWN